MVDGTRSRLVWVALAVGVCLCASTGTALARRPKPVIGTFTVAPAKVASEGMVRVTLEAFDEAGTPECTLSARPAVAELPERVPCRFTGEEGYEPVEFALRVPGNTGKKAVKYRFELVARGPGGDAKAKANVAVEPGPGREIATQITTGASHTCALFYTDHIDCWGFNSFGELGDGTTTGPEACGDYGCSSIPVATTGITNAGQVGAGGSQTCSVLVTGHVECWGANYFGQLGNGTLTSSDTPVEVSGITDATEVGSGGDYTCALLSTDRVDCWGENTDGELGDGTFKGPETCPWSEGAVIACSRKPVEVPGITNAVQLTAGELGACVLLSTHHVECWGDDEDGELGNGAPGPQECGGPLSGPTPCSTKPVEATGITTATQVAAGAYETCAALSSGRIDCWGDNEDGELGDGTTTGPESCLQVSGGDRIACSATPVQVADITSATQVSAGSEQACAVLSTGRAFCWGANGKGELGDGTTTSFDTPVEVAVISGVTQVSAGNSFDCALESSGRVYCWGYNWAGQLGDDSPLGSDEPVEVFGL